jgi:hypothetical protein
MHPLVAAILLRMARLDAFQLNAEPKPPHRKLAQPIERRRPGKGHAVIVLEDQLS